MSFDHCLQPGTVPSLHHYGRRHGWRCPGQIPSLLKKKINSDLLCRIIIIVVFFGAATALSTLGLDGILTTVNEINSACRLPVWYIPILILGPFSIHRVVKAQRQKKLAQSDGESG